MKKSKQSPNIVLNFESKTTRFFEKLNILWYITLFPKFWVTDVKLPRTFMKVYDHITKIMYGMLVLLLVAIIGAVWTQEGLTPKQMNTRNVGIISTTIILLYNIVYLSNRTTIRELFYNLVVVLKKEYNNEDVEENMLRRIKFFLFMISATAVGNTLSNGFNSITGANEEKFTVFITMWPDVHDPSKTALAVRIGIFVLWTMYSFQAVGSNSFVFVIPIIQSHQYKNLCSYFHDLAKIFDNEKLGQEEKEILYEKKFIVGIQWHVHTLKCMQLYQQSCKHLFNLQLQMVPTVLIMLMPEIFNTEHNINRSLKQLPLFLAILLTLGFSMWNAGDITAEAELLPSAMYASGWQNCQGKSSARVRKLLAIAMMVAGKPVHLEAYGFIKFSYSTYVTVVKTSYSMFALFV